MTNFKCPDCGCETFELFLYAHKGVKELGIICVECRLTTEPETIKSGKIYDYIEQSKQRADQMCKRTFEIHEHTNEPSQPMSKTTIHEDMLSDFTTEALEAELKRRQKSLDEHHMVVNHTKEIIKRMPISDRLHLLKIFGIYGGPEYFKAELDKMVTSDAVSYDP